MKYFITGTDTNIGKTVAVGYLANYFLKAGNSVITQKLVQTGCEGIAEDIIEHRRFMNIDLQDCDIDKTTCAYVLKYPASPHIVAEMENVEYDFDLISKNTQKLESRYNIVLIEGAGGLTVPLTQNYLTADYIIDNNIPVFIVVPSKLGSLNHALLSLEFCKQKNIQVAGIVYNTYPKAPTEIEESTREYLKKYLSENFKNAQLFNIGQIN